MEHQPSSVSLSDSRSLVMLTTAGRGGIRAVVDSYAHDGLFERWNVRVLYTHDEGSLLRRLAIAAKSLGQFAWMLVLGRVAILHSHVAMGGSFWRKAIFSELARVFRVPVILHVHGSKMEVFFNTQGTFGRRQIKRQLERADCVVVLSDSWRNFVTRIAPSAKCEVVVNYVVPPTSEACHRPHEGLRVLFLGLLGHRKGIFDLLPAFKRAIQRSPAMRLLVGGNGEVAETHTAIRDQNLIGAVEMLGWVSGEAKNMQLSMADVFVLPSYNEGMPISLLEAMSYGVPVISTYVGGIPELVRDGQDGFLIEAGDQQALEERLVQLACDSELRLRMGATGRKRVMEQFSNAAVLPILEGVFAKLSTMRSSSKRSAT